MKVKQSIFTNQVAQKEIKIAFIGMSNVGKTRVSKSLAKSGALSRIEVDELIQEKLKVASITSMASWMGFPYEEKYAAAEEAYLEMETDATLQAMDAMKAPAALDTTGSVIYLPHRVLERLKREWLIVHIAVTHTDVDELFKNFIAHPKPVVWGGLYTQVPGEPQSKALERSYKILLSDRISRYKALADVSIPRFELYKAKTAEDVFKAIAKRLPQ